MARAFTPATFLLVMTSWAACAEVPEAPGTRDGSEGEPPVARVGPAPSLTYLQNPTIINFDELAPAQMIGSDHYIASGVRVEIGPSSTASGYVRSGSAMGPCNATRSIQTEPFTGPSMLFRFPNGVTSVQVNAGDFSSTDEDVITLTAYGDDALTQVVDSQTWTLPGNVGNACVTVMVSAPLIRAVEVVSAGPFPNSIFIDDLVFTPVIIPTGPFFGADSSAHPDQGDFPTGAPPYDFYLGQVGFGNTPCDVGGLSPASGYAQCTAFQLPAAQYARNTFAFWYLKGPFDPAFKLNGNKYLAPYDAGRLQAGHLVQQWTTYNAISIDHDPSTGSSNSPIPGPVIDGRTLFGDIEPPLDSEVLAEAGWAVCPFEAPPGKVPEYTEGSDCVLEENIRNNYPANATRIGINRQLLRGFIDRILEAGLIPGIYTNPRSWIEAFGQGYSAYWPFALWTASCAAGPRTAAQASAELPAIANTTLGGMKTSIWQYQAHPNVDYNVTSRDPGLDFVPQPDAARTYRCTCGPGCPLANSQTNREYGLYLVATPERLDATSGTISLTNPTDEEIPISAASIGIYPGNTWFTHTTTCTAPLPPGGSCTIDVTYTPGNGNAPKNAARLYIGPAKGSSVVVPLGACGVGVVGC